MAKIGIGFVVALVILYLFGRVIGWGEISRTFADADVKWLLLALASTAVGLVAWAKAWDVILSLFDIDIPLPHLVVTYYAATFADYVTPLGKAGGGPLIAYILSTDDRINYQESLASVTSADLLNLLPYFGFALIGAAGLLVRGGLTRQANLLGAGLAVVAMSVTAGGYVTWRHQSSVTTAIVSLLSPVASRLSFLEIDSIRSSIQGFFTEINRISNHPRVLGRTLVFSVVGWIFFAAPLYFAGQTVGVAIDPFVVMFIVPASTVAGFVPTPGGVGGVEVALVGLLVAIASIPAGTAAAVALVYRFASYWFILAVGGIAAFYEIYAS
jgi:hypothetical protein